jgi:K+ transporter
MAVGLTYFCGLSVVSNEVNNNFVNLLEISTTSIHRIYLPNFHFHSTLVLVFNVVHFRSTTNFRVDLNPAMVPAPPSP